MRSSDTGFVTVSDHCAALSRVLEQFGWTGSEAEAPHLTARAGDLIFAAGGIRRVEVNVAQFDEDPGFCPNGVLEEQGEALSLAMTGLTRCLLIYGGIECIIKAIAPPRHRKYPGKIDSACAYLRDTYEPHFRPLDHYSCLVKALCDVINHTDVHGKDIIGSSDLMPGGSRGVSGIALHVAYQLRNALAHGSVVLPQYPALIGRDPNELFIQAANRSFLISGQMLLLAGLKGGRLTVEGLRDEDYTGEWARAAHSDPIVAISNLHLKPRADRSQRCAPELVI